MPYKMGMKQNAHQTPAQRHPRPATSFLAPLDELRNHSKNPRTHTDKKLTKLAEIIKANGDFFTPILINKESQILSGHARVLAARQLGFRTIPAIKVTHLTEAQELALMVAENKLVEEGRWNEEALITIFEELEIFDFPLELTGFDTCEVDLLFENNDAGDPEGGKRPRLPVDYQPVTQAGDIWQLGPHRLVCGDALKPETLQQLLGDELADMVFTDPPYNVKINGHVKKSGNSREFAMAGGEMSSEGFTAFLRSHMQAMQPHLRDGAIIYECMDWRHMRELQDAASGLFEIKNLCVWAKDRAGMGTFYRSQHELVFVFKHGIAPHINNFQLGQNGRYRSNVWDYPMCHDDGAETGVEGHPTPKPVSMIADALRDCSHRGGIVLDPFGGSGSTLIAAEHTGRKARLVELDPAYCDLIILRWQIMTNQKAVLASTGEDFETTRAFRVSLVTELQEESDHE